MWISSIGRSTLFETVAPCESFNFGPKIVSNKTVEELIASILEIWRGSWTDSSDPGAPHEANLLHLQIDKAHHRLGWQPRWDYSTTISRTVRWYQAVHEGSSPVTCCLSDLDAYLDSCIFKS